MNAETETMKLIFKALFKFQCEANAADFRRIFGDRVGMVLWDMFVRTDHNLLTLSNMLDSENFEKLAAHFPADW